ncbi:MAG: hypothetical protein V4694_05365 [Pseudomonadota bacterium]
MSKSKVITSGTEMTTTEESTSELQVSGDYKPIVQNKIEVTDPDVEQLDFAGLIQEAFTNIDNDEKIGEVFAALSNHLNPESDIASYEASEVIDKLVLYLNPEDTTVSEKTRSNAAAVLCNIASSEEGAKLLAREEIIEKIVEFGAAVQNQNKDARRNVTGLIANIARYPVGKKLLGSDDRVKHLLIRYSDGSIEHKDELLDEQLSAAIGNIANNPEAEAQLFNDAKTKETLFAMAENAGSDAAASGVARAIASICFCASEDTKNLYSDEDTRDVLMGLYSRHQGSAVSIASAISNVCTLEKRQIYDTEKTYELLMNGAKQAKNNNDVSAVACAITNVQFCGSSVKDYKSEETRDVLIGMTKVKEKSWLGGQWLGGQEKGINDSIMPIASAMHRISQQVIFDGDKESPYFDATTRDTLLEMAHNIPDGITSKNRYIAKGVSSDEARGSVASTIATISSNKDARELYAIPEVSSAIMDMLEKTTDPRDGGQIARAITNISACEQGKKLFCEGENAVAIKSKLMLWAEAAMQENPSDKVSKTDYDNAVKSIMGALETFSNSSPNFHDEEVKETIFKMGDQAKSPFAVASVLNSISRITHNNNDAAELYSGEDTQDFLMRMVAKHPNDDLVRGAVAYTIGNIASCEKGGERYCTTETKNMLLDWGNSAKSDEAIIGISNAIGNLAKYENEKTQSNIFAGQDVKDLLATMRDRCEANKLGNKQSKAQSYVDAAANQVAQKDKSLDLETSSDLDDVIAQLSKADLGISSDLEKEEDKKSFVDLVREEVQQPSEPSEDKSFVDRIAERSDQHKTSSSKGSIIGS